MWEEKYKDHKYKEDLFRFNGKTFRKKRINKTLKYQFRKKSSKAVTVVKKFDEDKNDKVIYEKLTRH